MAILRIMSELRHIADELDTGFGTSRRWGPLELFNFGRDFGVAKLLAGEEDEGEVDCFALASSCGYILATHSASCSSSTSDTAHVVSFYVISSTLSYS